MRTLLGILFGVVAAMMIVAGIEWAETALYPLPILDVSDRDTLANVVTDMPFPAKILVVFGWLIGAFGGVWLALRVCDRRRAGAIVVLAVIAAGIANVTTLPHPLWMQVCAVALPIVGGVAGMWAHRKPYPGEALLG